MNETLPRVATITSIRQDNYRTKTFELDCTVDAQVGQFVMIWLPRFDEKPFSLVNCAPLTLMVTAVGPFSHLMHEKKVGDQVWFRGPFGQGFAIEEKHQNIALIGGGYGVAPLYWLANRAKGKVESVTSILGAREGKDVLYEEQFATIKSQETTDYHLQITTEDGSLGVSGRVTDVLEPQLAAGNIDGIFACGPDGMLAALEKLSRRYDVPAQLSWEAYMRCAIGICGACDHRGKVLCMDGPVLSVD